MSANKTQVGGDHYRSKGIQPWDYITINNLGYLEGSVVKYISRWKEKGGVEDLKKAQHYLAKLIETAPQLVVERVVGEVVEPVAVKPNGAPYKRGPYRKTRKGK